MRQKSWPSVNLYCVSSYENLSKHVQGVRIGDRGSGSRHDRYSNSSFIWISANKVCRSHKTDSLEWCIPWFNDPNAVELWNVRVEQFPNILTKGCFAAARAPSHRVSNRLVLRRKLTDFSSGRLFSRVHLFPGSGSVWPLALSSPCGLDSARACVAAHSRQLCGVLVRLPLVSLWFWSVVISS